jgi:hypothetical protein
MGKMFHFLSYNKLLFASVQFGNLVVLLKVFQISWQYYIYCFEIINCSYSNFCSDFFTGRKEEHDDAISEND